jgi:hypothetical protein
MKTLNFRDNNHACPKKHFDKPQDCLLIMQNKSITDPDSKEIVQG